MCPGPSGGMADATDSKSVVRKDVWVQVPPRAPGDTYTHSNGSTTFAAPVDANFLSTSRIARRTSGG